LADTGAPQAAQGKGRFPPIPEIQNWPAAGGVDGLTDGAGGKYRV